MAENAMIKQLRDASDDATGLQSDAAMEIERLEAEADNLGDEIATLRAANLNYEDALRAIEWQCPVCGSSQLRGHRTGCAIGRALPFKRG